MKALPCFRVVILLILLGSLPGCGGCNRPVVPAVVLVPQGQDGILSLDRAVRPVEDAKASTARNFYVVLDGSGSMGERPHGLEARFRNKMEAAKWALEEYLRDLPSENINLGLYVFDAAGSSERLPLGPSNKEQFLKIVNEVRSGGGTPLSESIRIGVDKLDAQYDRQLGYGEYRLIVVTDGQASYLNEAAAYAASKRIPIYTIGFFIGQDHPLRLHSRSYIAADSGEQLRNALKLTAAEVDTFDVTSFEAKK